MRADLIAQFDIIHDAAMLGRLVAESDDMLDQEAAQLEAINVVGDFISNHHEAVEDRFANDPSFEVRARPPALDLDHLREVPIDHPLNAAILVTIELAAQQCHEEEAGLTAPLGEALDRVGDFWSRNGALICGETLSLTIPDGPR